MAGWRAGRPTDAGSRSRTEKGSRPTSSAGTARDTSCEPVLSLSPDRLTFDLAAGEEAAAQTVTVKNLGGGTLDAVTATVSYGDGADWLAAAISGAGNEQKITVSLNDAALSSGQHKATLEVTAGSAKGSPARCEIAVDVAGAAAKPDAGLAAAGSSGCALAGDPGRGQCPGWLLIALAVLLGRATSRYGGARR